MSRDYSTANHVHQQQGAVTVADFAAMHGTSEGYMLKLVKSGKVMGASKHPLSKRWMVYPPAKLLVSVRPSCGARILRAAPPSGAGAMAASGGHAGTYPIEAVIEASAPFLVDQQAPQGRAEPQPCASPDVFHGRQLKVCARDLKLAAARSYYPLVLSGCQVLAVECALEREAEAVKLRLDDTEFEPEAHAATGEKLNTLYATLRLLRQAVGAKHKQEAAQNTPGIEL